MDINVVTITGIIHDIGVHQTTGLYPVVEARLTSCVGHSKNEGALYDEFNVRAFGKKTAFIQGLKDGSKVTICGRLREDIRVNASNPDTTRSKVYINIDEIKL